MNRRLNFFKFALFTFAVLFCSCSQKKTASKEVSRIVCLCPSGLEILFATGAQDKIVAKTEQCNYPEEASSIPSAGGFDGSTLSAESILEYKPDFVYGSKGIHDLIASQLEQFGVRVYLSDASSIADVFNEILYISELTGTNKKGSALVQEMKDSLNQSLSIPLNKRVFYELWNSPYMSVGGTSFMNDVLTYAGGINIFAELKDPYPIVSEEAVVARDPEVIVISSMNGISAEEICSRPAWKNVSAVKNKKVFLVDADIFTRPGPRVIEAVKILHEILIQD